MPVNTNYNSPDVQKIIQARELRAEAQKLNNPYLKYQRAAVNTASKGFDVLNNIISGAGQGIKFAGEALGEGTKYVANAAGNKAQEMGLDPWYAQGIKDLPASMGVFANTASQTVPLFLGGAMAQAHKQYADKARQMMPGLPGEIAANVVEAPGQVVQNLVGGGTHGLIKPTVQPSTALGAITGVGSSLAGFAGLPGKLYYSPVEAPIERAVGKALGVGSQRFIPKLLGTAVAGGAAELASSFPIAAIESMASGRPFISTEKGTQNVPFTNIPAYETPISGTYPENVIAGLTGRAMFGAAKGVGQKFQQAFRNADQSPQGNLPEFVNDLFGSKPLQEAEVYAKYGDELATYRSPQETNALKYLKDPGSKIEDGMAAGHVGSRYYQGVGGTDTGGDAKVAARMAGQGLWADFQNVYDAGNKGLVDEVGKAILNDTSGKYDAPIEQANAFSTQMNEIPTIKQRVKLLLETSASDMRARNQQGAVNMFGDMFESSRELVRPYVSPDESTAAELLKRGVSPDNSIMKQYAPILEQAKLRSQGLDAVADFKDAIKANDLQVAQMVLDEIKSIPQGSAYDSFKTSLQNEMQLALHGGSPATTTVPQTTNPQSGAANLLGDLSGKPKVGIEDTPYINPDGSVTKGEVPHLEVAAKALGKSANVKNWESVIQEYMDKTQKIRIQNRPTTLNLEIPGDLKEITPKQLETISELAGDKPIYVSANKDGNFYTFNNVIDFVTTMHGNPAPSQYTSNQRLSEINAGREMSQRGSADLLGDVRKADLTDRIIAYEQGDLNTKETVKLFQDLVNNGQAFKLQGTYGRTAEALINAGLVKASGRANAGKSGYISFNEPVNADATRVSQNATAINDFVEGTLSNTKNVYSRKLGSGDRAVFSYGEHFPMAIIKNNGEVVVNSDKFSPTTSRHQGTLLGKLSQEGVTPVKMDTNQIKDLVTDLDSGADTKLNQIISETQKGNIELGESVYKEKAMPVKVAYEFYSPNITENTKIEDAMKAVDSQGQAAFKSITSDVDAKMGLKGEARTAIGDWSDGAENTVFNHITNPTDWDEVRYNTAVKGKIGNQKAVIPFIASSGGQDTLHLIDTGASDIVKLRGQLDQAGIQYRTLVPLKGGTQVLVFDPGSTLGDTIQSFVNNYGSQYRTVKGQGEFLGSDNSRAAGLKAYESVINEYEQKYPTRRHYTAGGGTGVSNTVSKNSTQKTSLKPTPTTGNVSIPMANIARSVADVTGFGALPFVPKVLKPIFATFKKEIDKRTEKGLQLPPELDKLLSQIGV